MDSSDARRSPQKPARPPIVELPDGDREELRLALAMNGGVSLAIWIGGVSMEIHRLIRKEGAYRDLLDLTQTDARADVMAGASAGGINGALLATALVFQRKSLERLRDVWLDDGAMSSLFRSPLERDPPSLMKGDAYFLERLRRVFREMAQGPRSSKERFPIHLTMTTTLLKGERVDFDDDFGTTIHEVTHRGQFTFRRNEQDDDFERPEIADQLALASRCTASFPGAFEASFVPIDEPTSEPHRPAMKGAASFTSSRYTVDGGVLVNKPVGPALRAILGLPAERQVRRVLAYVVPDPGAVPELAADDVAEIPSMAKAALSAVTLPRKESIALELEELRDHNRRVKSQRELRDLLLRLEAGTAATERADAQRSPSYVALAAWLFDAYRDSRRENTLTYVLDQLTVGTRRIDAGPGVRPHPWSRANLKRELRGALGETLPQQFPQPGRVGEWPWDVKAVEGVHAIAVDTLRQGLELALPEAGGEWARLRAVLRHARDKLGECLADLKRIRSEDIEYWKEQAAAFGQADDVAAEARRAVRGWRERVLARLDDLPERIIAVLVGAAPALWRIAELCRPFDEPGALDCQRRLMGMGLGRDPEAVSPPEVTRSLLGLAVVQLALTAGQPVLEQSVDLVQISADGPNGFDGRTEPSQKLAGIQLGHFGAFYKRSWRANDWMWGRLDAAQRLARVVLSPKRIRRLALATKLSGPERLEHVVRCVQRVALGPADGLGREALAGLWDEGAIREELDFVARDPTGLEDEDLPPGLPRSATAVARRIQLEVLVAELPNVARAITAERGASVSASAKSFAEAVLDAERRGGSAGIHPADAVGLFPKCEVGLERISGEYGSDLFTATASTAAAVAVSAAAGKRSGLGTLRAVLSSLRGFTLALYVLASSAVGKSGTPFAVLMTLLATGGAILGLAVADQKPSGALLWLGLALVAAGLTLAALRSVPWWVLGFILASVAAVILPLEALDRRGPLNDLRPALIVAVLVVASMLLGLLHAPVVGSLRNVRRASLVIVALAAGLLAGLSWGFGWPPVAVGASLLLVGLGTGWALLSMREIAESVRKTFSALRRWARGPETVRLLRLVSRAAAVAAGVALAGLLYLVFVSLVPMLAVAVVSAVVGVGAGLALRARVRSRELRLEIEPVGDDERSFLVTWSSAEAPEGMVFDVEVQAPGKHVFTTWRLAERAGSALFRAPSEEGGIYVIRVRRRREKARWYWGWSAPGSAPVSTATADEGIEPGSAPAPDERPAGAPR